MTLYYKQVIPISILTTNVLQIIVIEVVITKKPNNLFKF